MLISLLTTHLLRPPTLQVRCGWCFVAKPLTRGLECKPAALKARLLRPQSALSRSDWERQHLLGQLLQQYESNSASRLFKVRLAPSKQGRGCRIAVDRFLTDGPKAAVVTASKSFACLGHGTLKVRRCSNSVCLWLKHLFFEVVRTDDTGPVKFTSEDVELM